MQPKKLSIIITTLILLLAACNAAVPASPAAPASLVFTDGRGVEVLLSGPAQRIVSLAPSNTELLFAVGAEAQVVGRDAFSDFPEAALEVTDIGGGWGEIDTETLLALEPDLVLSADIIAAEQNTALEALGL